ncbi:MAG TPA: uroporphyrinogen decarboxylase family protein [Dehalococcoidia bacterium]|nr:uroporphyrinogen decarboxylase family protein [Dehalococcoidia bacterium]
MVSSKSLVKDLFQLKELPRPPFIPWVSSFAARLEQVSVRQMLSDATLLSRSLANAQSLFGYDAIISGFDPSVEAEACGCRTVWGAEGELPTVASHPLREGATIEDLRLSEIEKRGRLPVVLESVRRLGITKGRDVALIGVITGPLTLAAHLRGSINDTYTGESTGEVVEVIRLAGKAAVRLCRAYCELGADVVALADEMLGRADPTLLREVASIIRTVHNIAGYYNAHTMVVARESSQDNIDSILEVEADGLAVPGHTSYIQTEGSRLTDSRCFSMTIPTSALLGTSDEIRKAAEERLAVWGKRRMFLSTEWDVPYQTAPDNMHELMRAIRQ